MFNTIEREQHNGIEIITLRGQFIGGEETDRLRSVLTEVAHSGAKLVVLDLSSVSYLNSTALGVLIAAHSTITRNGGKIVLCGLSQSLENIFVITKLSMVFDIYKDRQSALETLSQALSTNL